MAATLNLAALPSPSWRKFQQGRMVLSVRFGAAVPGLSRPDMRHQLHSGAEHQQVERTLHARKSTHSGIPASLGRQGLLPWHLWLKLPRRVEGAHVTGGAAASQSVSPDSPEHRQQAMSRSSLGDVGSRPALLEWYHHPGRSGPRKSHARQVQGHRQRWFELRHGGACRALPPSGVRRCP